MTRGITNREDGFSLLELTAVLAIYGLLAVVSLQVLTGALGNSGRAEAAGQRAIDLAAALSVMRRDMETMAPVAESGPAFRMGSDGALDVVREVAIDDAPGLERTVWRVDPMTEDLIRATGDDPTDRTMLTGVADWAVRVKAEPGGWMAAETWVGASPVDLPRGVEVVLTLADLGDVRLVVVR